MIEKIKNSLIVKNHELKAENNTLRIHNGFLMDKRIDELLKALGNADAIEEKDKKIRRLEGKVEGLKELLKEISNGKAHKS